MWIRSEILGIHFFFLIVFWHDVFGRYMGKCENKRFYYCIYIILFNNTYFIGQLDVVPI